MDAVPEGFVRPYQTEGQILALDLGDKRIGVAVSDQTNQIARSLQVIKRGSRQDDFQKILTVVSELNIRLIVVGLPVLSSGKEGSRAAWARDYAADLAKQIGLDVVLWDESLSTVDAEASMRTRGILGKRRRQRVDAVAAAFILQSYLDAIYHERDD